MKRRRANPRATLSVPVQFGGLSGHGPVRGVCRDLSAGGMFVMTPSPAPPGEVLELRMHDHGRPLGVGRVVWCRNQADIGRRPAGMGIQFVRLEPDSVQMVDDLLARRGADAARRRATLYGPGSGVPPQPAEEAVPAPTPISHGRTLRGIGDPDDGGGGPPPISVVSGPSRGPRIGSGNTLRGLPAAQEPPVAKRGDDSGSVRVQAVRQLHSHLEGGQDPQPPRADDTEAPARPPEDDGDTTADVPEGEHPPDSHGPPERSHGEASPPSGAAGGEPAGAAAGGAAGAGGAGKPPGSDAADAAPPSDDPGSDGDPVWRAQRLVDLVRDQQRMSLQRRDEAPRAVDARSRVVDAEASSRPGFPAGAGQRAAGAAAAGLRAGLRRLGELPWRRLAEARPTDAAGYGKVLLLVAAAALITFWMRTPAAPGSASALGAAHDWLAERGAAVHEWLQSPLPPPPPPVEARRSAVPAAAGPAPEPQAAADPTGRYILHIVTDPPDANAGVQGMTLRTPVQVELEAKPDELPVFIRKDGYQAAWRKVRAERFERSGDRMEYKLQVTLQPEPAKTAGEARKRSGKPAKQAGGKPAKGAADSPPAEASGSEPGAPPVVVPDAPF